MTTQRITELAFRVKGFPPFPAVANRVMALTADPESSIQDLMDVIGADQSLAIMILKMANSPFFGLSKSVVSLKQALTVLGFKEIQTLVLSRAVFDSFKNMGEGNGFKPERFWQHSFVCGLGANLISTALGWPGSAFFVAGLIHDIGKLIMYMTFPLEFSEAADRVKRGEEKPFEAEKNAFGVTHEEVGAMLLKRWMFPENLIAAVQYHHRPRQLKGDFRFPLVVYAADVLAHLDEIAEEDQAPDPGLHFLDPEVLELFQAYGLIWDDSVLERFSVDLSGQKEENAEVLNLFLS